RVELREEEKFKKVKKKNTLKIFGYKLNRNGSPKKRFWAERIEGIKKPIEKFSKRNLSFKDKIL
ncbi:12176_t:CDS:1, partial [Gigaspora rosea]